MSLHCRRERPSRSSGWQPTGHGNRTAGKRRTKSRSLTLSLLGQRQKRSRNTSKKAAQLSSRPTPLKEWDDKSSGQRRNKLTVRGESFQFVGGKGESDSGSADRSASRSTPAPSAASPAQLRQNPRHEEDDQEYRFTMSQPPNNPTGDLSVAMPNRLTLYSFFGQ